MAELWTTEGRKKLATVADILAVAIAVSLPWSTSATGILVGLWFFTLVTAFRWDELRLEIFIPGGRIESARHRIDGGSVFLTTKWT